MSKVKSGKTVTKCGKNVPEPPGLTVKEKLDVNAKASPAMTRNRSKRSLTMVEIQNEPEKKGKKFISQMFLDKSQGLRFQKVELRLKYLKNK